MVRCPKCGREIRYITAAPSAGSNGIIPVETGQEELISETGRVLRGYRVHECRGVQQKCNSDGIATDTCRAFKDGDARTVSGVKFF
jgi:hypothetical protein